MKPNPVLDILERSRYRPVYNPREVNIPFACDGCTYDGQLKPACVMVQEEELARQQFQFDNYKQIFTSTIFRGQCPKLYEANQKDMERKRNMDPVDWILEKLREA